MGILANVFTWWNGATFGTWLGLRGKTQVGTDDLGNAYYEGGRDTAGNPRRWVIYAGSNHQIEGTPEQSLPPVRQWQKPAVPNQTGTALAYRPPGVLDKGGARVRATGDYEAWSPDA
jgi:NADH:ubiquinone oxidoreductase subunit